MRSRRSNRLRRDAVDAGSAVLAGQPVGLPHPIQIDDVVERAQRRSPFRLRQIGYPWSVRGQVCRVQSPLPCFRSTVLYLLEGSVQRDQNRVRVNAQLIDAASGAHLWADRFEEDVADLFKLT